DKPKDMNLTLKLMLRKLDPYTTYIDEETLERFKSEVDGKFRGIGIQIRKDADTDHILVVTPIKDSPAYKAKLQAGDLITTIIRDIDSKGNPLTQPQETPTKGLDLPDANTSIIGRGATKRS